METVHRWGVFQAEFTSEADYDEPFRDVRLRCSFKSPNRRTFWVEAFWDGDLTWRVRFMPDTTGRWKYRTVCSNIHDKRLHGRTGSFECVSYEGGNPLYTHGPLRLSDNRRYLVHADGSPFFWLADTAWNGAIKSTLDEWREYLDIRREQGFTAIQFVSTHWRGGPYDDEGEKAFEGQKKIMRLNADFFKRIDPKFAMLNERGFVAVPVLLWAIQGDINPGWTLVEEDAVLLARYLVARYGAHVLVWILGGDGYYTGEYADRWKRIGRAVFTDKNRQLVSMHLCGKHWILPEFLHEEWLDIIGYQSGHGVDEDTLRWLCQGPPSKDWKLAPPRPILNFEPNYEAHLAYRILKPITPRQVRRAAYWSLLIAPTAGVSYGTNGVWSWARKPEVPINHPHVGVADPWRKSVTFHGAEDMSRLKHVFAELPWWTLYPDPELLGAQPGIGNIELFIVASRATDRRIAVIYVPQKQSVHLNLWRLERPLRVTWLNPRTAEKIEGGTLSVNRATLKPPGHGDWLLILKAIS